MSDLAFEAKPSTISCLHRHGQHEHFLIVAKWLTRMNRVLLFFQVPKFSSDPRYGFKREAERP